MKLVLVVLHLHSSKYIIEGLGLWCFTQQCFLYIVAGVSLVEYREKTTDQPQTTDKLYHIMSYRVHYGSGERH